jgi:hypothetical protein
MGLVGLVTQYYTRQDSPLAHIPEKAGRQSEMEFLDIKFNKRLESMLHSPFYWRILKTIFLCGLINPYKKSAKQENSSLFMNSILQNGKMMVENQTKSRV